MEGTDSYEVDSETFMSDLMGKNVEMTSSDEEDDRKLNVDELAQKMGKEEVKRKMDEVQEELEGVGFDLERLGEVSGALNKISAAAKTSGKSRLKDMNANLLSKIKSKSSDYEDVKIEVGDKIREIRRIEKEKEQDLTESITEVMASTESQKAELKEKEEKLNKTLVSLIEYDV